jgi:hypothetical protein
VLAPMTGAAGTKGRPQTWRVLGIHAPAHVQCALAAHA